jgi:ubiquinone/menaquinone biosynthesis C-methylase UbiE
VTEAPGISGRLAVTAAAYGAVSARYAELVRGELDALPLDRAVLAAFAEHVRAGGGLVADAGCGEGRIGAHLAGLGLDVTGVDLSPALIEIARARHPGIRFQVGSMHALPLADGSLAGVVAWYSLIHAEPGDLPSYLAEFGRVLRPGGHLLAAFFEAVDEPVTRYEHKVTPAYRWPVDALARLAREAGFAEVGRMSREPPGGARFRRGHLLMRRRQAAATGMLTARPP